MAAAQASVPAVEALITRQAAPAVWYDLGEVAGLAGTERRLWTRRRRTGSGARAPMCRQIRPHFLAFVGEYRTSL